MSQLGKSNLNLNLNLNLGGGNTGADGPPGVRFNTEEFRKLANINALAEAGRALQRVRFREFWNPELQANLYVNAFVRTHPDWLGIVAGVTDPREAELRAGIEDQLRRVLDAAPERESRFAEIIDQDSAEGALSYYFGMLMLEPAVTPATTLLVRVARRIGELVVMCLKHRYRFPRPSQLCPAIVPMMDVPTHPSFPSGHSLQSRLISLCLKAARPDLPDAGALLDDLAERLGHNRIIAGIHYPHDHLGGVEAAEKCYALLTLTETQTQGERIVGVPEFRQLLELAKGEFSAQATAPSRLHVFQTSQP